MYSYSIYEALEAQGVQALSLSGQNKQNPSNNKHLRLGHYEKEDTTSRSFLSYCKSLGHLLQQLFPAIHKRPKLKRCTTAFCKQTKTRITSVHNVVTGLRDLNHHHGWGASKQGCTGKSVRPHAAVSTCGMKHTPTTTSFKSDNFTFKFISIICFFLSINQTSI